MKNKITAVIVGIGALGALGGVASAKGSGADASAGPTGAAPAAAGSRLDDGKQLLAQAKVSEQEAIVAALSAAQGDLNGVDLEESAGKLVWNVDVCARDVKVDAGSGKVVNVSQDD